MTEINILAFGIKSLKSSGMKIWKTHAMFQKKPLKPQKSLKNNKRGNKVKLTQCQRTAFEYTTPHVDYGQTSKQHSFWVA